MFRPVIEKGLGSNLSQECCSLTRDVVGRKPQMKPSCVTHLTVLSRIFGVHSLFCPMTTAISWG